MATSEPSQKSAAPKKFHVLICDRFDVEAFARLKADPRLRVETSAQPIPTASELENCEALIIRSRTKITTELLNLSPQLSLIVTATSGFDHIDLNATKNLAVAHTPNANADSATELTWALILATTRRLGEAQKAVKLGHWDRSALIGRELSGKTLGIVGLGRIGTRVARIGSAFGMKIAAFDPYLESTDFAKACAERLSYEELLRLTDVLTFHVPDTRETRHMLRASHLELMSRHAIVVNASRGPVIREPDLVAALSEGWIAGCGLDVYEREPLPRDSRLMSFPNVILTPHLGATTSEAFARSSQEAASIVLRFLEVGREALGRDALPPTAEWHQAGFRAAEE